MRPEVQRASRSSSGSATERTRGSWLTLRRLITAWPLSFSEPLVLSFSEPPVLSFSDPRVGNAMDSDDPVAIGSSMGRLLRSLEGGRQGTQGVAAVGGVFGRWSEVVGEAMAMHVQPIRLDRDRLVVQVTEPAWATQVRLLTDQIRARLREVVAVEVDHVEVRVANPAAGRRRR